MNIFKLSGYGLIFFVCLSGCSAKWHLRQAEKKGATVTVDTVYKLIEVIIPEIKYDTIIQVENWNDTITIVMDSLITTIKVNYKDRTVFLKNNLKPMTKVIRVPIKVETIIKPKDFYKDLFYGLAAINLLVLFIAWLVYKSKPNKQ